MSPSTGHARTTLQWHRRLVLDACLWQYSPQLRPCPDPLVEARWENSLSNIHWKGNTTNQTRPMFYCSHTKGPARSVSIRSDRFLHTVNSPLRDNSKGRVAIAL